MLLLLLACAPWKVDSTQDLDGDGYSVADGDCWDDPAGPQGFAGKDIHPEADDAPYDGVDANCDGASDFDADGDGFEVLGVGEDCNDDPSVEITVLNGFPQVAAKDIFPGATEVWYDGVDEDCGDGVLYESGAVSAADFDQDGDGAACAEPADAEGYCTGDCDDTDPSLKPNGLDEQIWYDGIDDNCDGNDGDQDGDGHAVSDYPYKLPGTMKADDCKDDPSESLTSINGFPDLTAAEVYPGASETWYDGLDQDCGGEDDFDQDGDGEQSLYFKNETGDEGGDCFDRQEDDFPNEAGLPPEEVHPGADDTWYDGTDQDCQRNDDFDQDYDGYQASDYGGEDCDDLLDRVHPGLIEDCVTPYDDNCNGQLSEQNGTGATVWYPDHDGDGYGSGAPQYWCEGGNPSTDYTGTTNDDCDDGDPNAHPGATEICDPGDVDEDCNGSADDQDPSVILQSSWYADNDQDGYGDPYTLLLLCDLPSGYVADSSDCDDSNSDIHPGAAEVCDAVDTDENCDGLADDNDPNVSGKQDWYADADGDTYGDPSLLLQRCEQPSGYVLAEHSDCDDSNSSVRPSATEICDPNNVDENCNGLVDDSDSGLNLTTRSTWYVDNDGDSYGRSTSGTLRCDQPAGYVTDATDCDDTLATVNPGATEVCDPNNVDENCNGLTDDSDTTVDPSTQVTWYRDADGDSYGSPSSSRALCEQPTGYVLNSTDCNDSKSSISPAATEVCDASNTDEDCDGNADDADASVSTSTYTTFYADSDGDAYGNSSVSKKSCDTPAGYVTNSTDCDDTSASVNPGALEVCDPSNVDDDCDGKADDNDGSATQKISYYRDSDGDGYGDASVSTTRCDAPSGYVTDNTDCDDADASITSGGQEICDAANVDEDCDGKADDNDPSVLASTQSTWFQDADSDGYGLATASKAACDSPSGYVADSTDCDDTDSRRNPGRSEVCDSTNRDEDCDLLADDNDPSVASTGKSTFYLDSDGDTYGTTTSSVSRCDKPTGYATNKTDCNDGNASVNPAAQEVCDASNVDEDCDGVADDNDFSVLSSTKTTYYLDSDADTYGGYSSKIRCDQPSGYVTNNTDCNDSNSAINPGVAEICDANNTDEDCDGLADDLDTYVLGLVQWYRDADNDGYGTATSTLAACDTPAGYLSNSSDCNDNAVMAYPGATEYCDGIQNDCNTAWSSTSENDLVTLIDGASGAYSALSWPSSGSAINYSITGGTASKPNTINVCRPNTGEYRVRLQATTGSTYTNIIGINQTALTNLNATGSGNAPVLYINDNSYGIQIYVEYLVLTGGTGTKFLTQTYGGGIMLIATSDSEAELILDHCEVTGNAAGYGGGIAQGHYSSALSYGDITLSDTKVYYNNSSSSGGGVYMKEGSLDCTATSASYGFYANNASKGGAIYIAGSSTSQTFVTSSGCYWGVSGDDNTPDDIYGASFSSTYTWSNPAGNTFTCNYLGCI